MLKRLLALSLSLFLVVLEIPLSDWRVLSENEREAIRQEATTAFMRGLGPGATGRIWEDIFNGKWQLHIEPTDRCLPIRNKETI